MRLCEAQKEDVDEKTLIGISSEDDAEILLSIYAISHGNALSHAHAVPSDRAVAIRTDEAATRFARPYMFAKT